MHHLDLEGAEAAAVVVVLVLATAESMEGHMKRLRYGRERDEREATASSFELELVLCRLGWLVGGLSLPTWVSRSRVVAAADLGSGS